MTTVNCKDKLKLAQRLSMLYTNYEALHSIYQNLYSLDADDSLEVKQYSAGYKVTDYSTAGSPTIAFNGIASGFSSSNQVYSSSLIDLREATTFEYSCEFTTGSTLTGTQVIWEQTNNFYLGFTGSTIFVTADGGTTSISVSNKIQAQTSYVTKVTYKDGVTTLYLNNEELGTNDEWTYSTINRSLYMGTKATSGQMPFQGSIDLKQLTIKIDGELKYCPWVIKDTGILKSFNIPNYHMDLNDSFLSGAGSPQNTVIGVKGQTYIDTDNKYIYVCTADGSSNWVLTFSASTLEMHNYNDLAHTGVVAKAFGDKNVNFNTKGIGGSKTYEVMTPPLSHYLLDITHGNNTYLAISSGNTTNNILRSTNLSNWSATSSSSSSRDWHSITYGDDVFVIGSWTSLYTYSTDSGQTWVEGNLESDVSVITYYNNKFIAYDIGYSTTGYHIEAEDIATGNWTSITFPYEPWSLTFGGGKYVIVGAAYSPTTRYLVSFSTDLINWTTQDISSLFNRRFNACEVSYANGKFFIIPSSQPSGNTMLGICIDSANLISTSNVWTSIQLPFITGGANWYTKVLYRNNKYTLLRHATGSIESSDGIHWNINQNIPSPTYSAYYGWQSAITANGNIIAITDYLAYDIDLTPFTNNTAITKPYIGNLFNLKTITKNSLVNALNEIQSIYNYYIDYLSKFQYYTNYCINGGNLDEEGNPDLILDLGSPFYYENMTPVAYWDNCNPTTWSTSDDANYWWCGNSGRVFGESLGNGFYGYSWHKGYNQYAPNANGTWPNNVNRGCDKYPIIHEFTTPLGPGVYKFRCAGYGTPSPSSYYHLKVTYDGAEHRIDMPSVLSTTEWSETAEFTVEDKLTKLSIQVFNQGGTWTGGDWYIGPIHLIQKLPLEDFENKVYFKVSGEYPTLTVTNSEGKQSNVTNINPVSVESKIVRHYYKYQYSSWTQPVLTADGTVGESNFAVLSNPAVFSTYHAWHPFNPVGIQDLHTGWVVQANSADYVMYNPVPLKITNIQIQNRNEADTPRSISGGIVYGSNDNSSWIELKAFTNSTIATLATWNIDLSTNNNAYKYYKIACQNSDVYIGIGKITLTANQQTVVESTAADYDFYVDVEESIDDGTYTVLTSTTGEASLENIPVYQQKNQPLAFRKEGLVNVQKDLDKVTASNFSSRNAIVPNKKLVTSGTGYISMGEQTTATTQTYSITTEGNYLIELVGGGGGLGFTDGGTDTYNDTAWAHHYGKNGADGATFKGIAHLTAGTLQITSGGAGVNRAGKGVISGNGGDSYAVFTPTGGTAIEIARAGGGHSGFPEGSSFASTVAGGTVTYNNTYITQVLVNQNGNSVSGWQYEVYV